MHRKYSLQAVHAGVDAAVAAGACQGAGRV